MVYRKYHEECKVDCTRLMAYVRIDGKWTIIGHYGSECKQFEPFDLEKEEQERLQKEKFNVIKEGIRQTKQEGKERLKIMKDELNINNTFYREQTSK